VPYSATLDVGSSFTFAAWVYMADNTSSYAHILYRGGSYCLQLPVLGSDDHLYFWQDTSGPGHSGIMTWPDTIGSTGMTVGAWHHVAVILDAGVLTAYIDGVADADTSAVGSTVPGLGDDRGMWIGMEFPESGYNSPMRGMIDDLAIFKRALSPSELATVMAGDFSAFLPAAGEGVITSNPGRGFIEAGKALTLTAPAGAYSYQWRFNGLAMEDTERITGTNSRVLSFNPVLEEDAGIYTCVMDDGMGKAFSETAPYVLEVLAEGSLPVAGVIGLGLLTALTAIGGIVIGRRK